MKGQRNCGGWEGEWALDDGGDQGVEALILGWTLG